MLRVANKNNSKRLFFFCLPTLFLLILCSRIRMLMKERQGSVYLIPSPIGIETPSLGVEVLEKVRELRYFAVEEERTARRFLSDLEMPIPISAIHFTTLNKDSTSAPVEFCLNLLRSGESVGVISEAGMPGIADPGAQLVFRAHEEGITVVPLVGASSILLTLAASGLNGQNFAFLGYLPVKSNERRNRILQIETRSRIEQQTQIFIETPYRNETMYAELLEVLAPSTYLCVANGVYWTGGFIRTLRVSEWRKHRVELGKLPTVFALLAEKSEGRRFRSQ